MIRPIEEGDVEACSALLARLPAWFGIPEVNAGYVESLRELPAWVAVEAGTVVGFAAALSHTPGSTEISVMAVDPDLHRRGYGRALVAAVEAWCRDNGVAWLHVKTRGASTYDDDYERTRRFYLAMGFEMLYESLTEWGEENAALVLVKHLERESVRA
ncbi:MAG TPA: GNAT family N-acetyltransferase [Acidimicrobiales bacterium]|nr:GNAT family N-acetyltransferase [Acidimicrobiales bacterium]